MTSSIAITARFDRGLSWSLHGAGQLACRSHALVADDGGIWLIDPIDGAGLDAALDELGGSVGGVVVLLDRHLRDAPAVAGRHGVPLLVPPGRWRAGHAPPRGSVPLSPRVDGCPFTFLPLVERDGAWLEQALWWEEQEMLVVAEAIGTTEYCRVPRDAPFGMHPVLRFGARCRALSELPHEPRLLLVGHGEPVRAVDIPALGDGIRSVAREARSGIPRMLMRVPGWIVGGIQARRAGRHLSC
ncbi:MAG: hypothetical protein H7287_05970 [Thermoleophilia bacterium]|nr:hypothetical protein [Thermoleophilia bacterium]